MQSTHTLDAQARHMLETVLRDLPEPGEPAADSIDTAAMLIRLAKRWPKPPDERAYQDLQMLCRQIAVPQKVLRYYPADGSKAQQAQMLPVDYWPLLIAVLLSYAEQHFDDEPLSRELAFKCLNGALQALDIAKRFGDVPHLAAMSTWAECIAECVTSENTA